MTTQFGFSKEFVQSGDLRLYLAMAEPGTERRQLFDKYVHYDDLITSSESGRTILGYNQAAISRRTEFCNRAYDTHSGFKSGERTYRFGAMYDGGTCVLVGSSPTQDLAAVEKLRSSGAVIVALGNAIHGDLVPDIWIGHHDTIGYNPAAIESEAIQAFIPEEFKDSPMFDFVAKKQIKKTPDSHVNVLGYTVLDTKVQEFLDNPVHLSTFGHNTTFTVALSLVSLLGFRDIILHGIQMGTDIDNFYAFSEIPHKETVDRKFETYTALRKDFTSIYTKLTEHDIRISSCGDIPGLEIPSYTEKYIYDALSRVMSLSRRLSSSHRTRVTVPAARTREYLQLLERHRQAQVTPLLVLDNMEDLVQHMPAAFGTTEAQVEIAKVRQAIASAKCKGCVRSKYAAPLYKIFESHVLQDPRAAQQGWKAALPEHYILKVSGVPHRRGELIFRGDKAEEQVTYNNLQV